MRFFLKLLFLELKRLTQMMPRLLMGALALCGVLAVFAIMAQGLLYKSQPVEKLTISVYVPEDDKYIGIMMNIVENIESVEKLCKFQYVDSEEAVYSAVEKQEAYGGVIFPKSFVQGIVRGDNYPARVVILENQTGSALFKELTESGSDMLGAVQAGIYAFIDEYKLEYKEYPREKLVDSINMEYVDYVLPREKYFSLAQWSATNSLTPVEYYISAVITLLLLFFGMSCVKIVHCGHSCVYEIAKSYGINGFWRLVINHITVFVMFLALTGLIICGLAFTDMEPEITPYILLGIFIASAVVTGICFVIDGDVGAGLVLFAYTVLSGALSGCFLPVSFLPDKINAAYKYIPTYYIMKCFDSIFGQVEINLAEGMLVIAVVYGCIAVAGNVKK